MNATSSGPSPTDPVYYGNVPDDRILDPRHQLPEMATDAWQPVRSGGSGSADQLTGLIDAETTPKISQGLGWFSIGLGVAQLLAPGAVNRMIGVQDTDRSRAIQRLVGIREIGAGIGILSSERPVPWLWSRVAGDMMDITLLAAAMNSDDNDTDRVAGAIAAVFGISALDYLTSDRFTRYSDLTQNSPFAETPEVRKYITVNRPVEEVYNFWHDFRNLPRFMPYLESVEVTGDRRSHWVAKAPFGRTIEWDAETTLDSRNEEIAWRSLPGGDIENAGTVRFIPAPGNRGTEVHVDMTYSIPGGTVVARLAKLFPENPDREVYDDLRAFKQVMEVGEVVLSEAVAGGSRIKQHPAQPPERSHA